MGFEQYLQEQLHPEKIFENPTLALNLSARHFLEWIKLSRFLWQQSKLYSPEEFEGIRLTVENEFAYRQAIQDRVLHSLFSERQLQELLVEFWCNHFNVSGTTNTLRSMVGAYEATIRPLVLGNFQTLLSATMRSPAMLTYLDNWVNNYTPPSDSATDIAAQRKPYNENYARELLELHTLGANDAYSQADVENLARILTGWGLSSNPSDNAPQQNKLVTFMFHSAKHDLGDKILLGNVIKGEGEPEIEKAAAILAHHPATAKNISYKLAQYFLAEQPPEALVDTLSKVFEDTQGDIRSFLITLFQSEQFFQADFIHNQFKTPYQYVISLLRMSDISFVNILGTLGNNNDRELGVFDALSRLDMIPFAAHSPKGYDGSKQTWLTDQGLLQRLYIATSIPSGVLSHWSWHSHQALRVIVEPQLPDQTQQVLQNSPPEKRTKLLMGVPFLMYR